MTARTRWMMYAALALLPLIGALAGMAYAGGKPPIYTAEARLAMGRSDTVDPTSVAQAENLARFLSSAAVMAELPPARVISVTASPIPQSTVIRVEARALDPANAVEAAKLGMRTLQSKVTQAAGKAKAQATLNQLKKLNRQVATYQSQVNASGGSGSDYVEAQTQLSSLQAQQQATSTLYQDQAKAAANTDLTVVAQAGATGDDSASRKQIYLLAGLGIGALIAYVISRVLSGVVPMLAKRPDQEPPQPAGRERERERERERFERRVLDVPEEPTLRRPVYDHTHDKDHEHDEETRQLLAILPVQPEAKRQPQQPEHEAQPAASASSNLTPRGHPAPGASRRGLNGLRQDSPQPSRSWP